MKDVCPICNEIVKVHKGRFVMKSTLRRLGIKVDEYKDDYAYHKILVHRFCWKFKGRWLNEKEVKT